MSTNNTSAIGQAAEDTAACFLSTQGYKIIARNVRYKLGELDIVALEDDILCFVEVRSRENSRHSDPKASVRANKQTKLIRAATLYLQKHYPRKMPRCRFDVLGITGYGSSQKFDLIKHAFTLDLEPKRRSGSPWQAY